MPSAQTHHLSFRPAWAGRTSIHVVLMRKTRGRHHMTSRQSLDVNLWPVWSFLRVCREVPSWTQAPQHPRCPWPPGQDVREAGCRARRRLEGGSGERMISEMKWQRKTFGATNTQRWELEEKPRTPGEVSGWRVLRLGSRGPGVGCGYGSRNLGVIHCFVSGRGVSVFVSLSPQILS